MNSCWMILLVLTARWICVYVHGPSEDVLYVPVISVSTTHHVWMCWLTERQAEIQRAVRKQHQKSGLLRFCRMKSIPFVWLRVGTRNNEMQRSQSQAAKIELNVPIEFYVEARHVVNGMIFNVVCFLFVPEKHIGIIFETDGWDSSRKFPISVEFDMK